MSWVQTHESMFGWISVSLCEYWKWNQQFVPFQDEKTKPLVQSALMDRCVEKQQQQHT